MAEDDPDLIVLRDLADEVSLNLEVASDYQRVLFRFRTSLHDALRRELLSQLDISTSDRRYELLTALADEIAQQHHLNNQANDNRAYLPRVPLKKRLEINNWLNQYRKIEGPRIERATALFDQLPRIDLAQLETKLLDRFVKTLSDLIAERIEQTKITAILGTIAINSDSEISSVFSDVAVFLKALGVWWEFKTHLRILTLRALASIRSPWAYYWISQCIGELDETTDGPSKVAREAMRLLSHDNDYATTGVIRSEMATGFYTYEKWVGLSFTIDHFEEGDISLYAQGLENRGPLLSYFRDKLELAVLDGRSAKRLSTEGFVAPESNGSVDNAALANQRKLMRRTLHREGYIDPSTLISFIGNGDGRLNLYADMSANYGPLPTFKAKIRNQLQIPPEQSVINWIKSGIVGSSPCENSF